MNSNPLEDFEQSSKLTYQQMVEDLKSIPLNEDDVIFSSKIKSLLEGIEKTESNDDDLFYKRLENYILFKSNLESNEEKQNSELSLDSVTRNIKSLENSIGSLQDFIKILEKLQGLNK